MKTNETPQNGKLKKLYQTLPDFKTTKELPVCRETDSALWRQPKI
jgi:hypothetical protein